MGGTHISVASRESGGMLPQKIFLYSMLDSDLILGGGGTQAGGGKSQGPPPHSVCNPANVLKEGNRIS